jgi:DNA-binding transcriptional LysR family regulator
VTKLAPVQDIAIAGLNFEYLRGRVLDCHELMQLPLVMLYNGSTTRKFINSYFAADGLVPEGDIEVKTLDLVTPVVENGLGIGFVTTEFAGKALEEGRVFRLDLARQIPQRYVCMLHDPAKPMMPAAKKFAQMLMQDG